MALKVGELFALFTLDTSGVNRGLDNVDAKLQQLSSQFTQYGYMWKRSITDPIVNFGKDAVETSRQTQYEMSKTYAKAFTGLSTEEAAEATEELNNEMQRVAKDSVFTTQEVAGAYDKMAMAGWGWQSMVAGLEPIMDLAAASGEDVVTVSDIVTDAMTAFGLTFENAGYDIETFNGYVTHFTDVLASAATNSNTDISKMGESFKYAASMAGTMGYNIDDVAVALGLMANRGTKASQAGTSLRRMLTVLSDPTPTKDQAAWISELGISLQDEEGKAYSFMELMLQLRESFDGLDIDAEGFQAQLEALREDYYAAVEWGEEWEALGGIITDTGEIVNTEASKEVYNKSSMEDYLEYLEEVDKLTARLLDSEQNDAALTKVGAANDLFGARGMLALLAIIQASDEEFNSLVADIEGSEGATHTMKETMLDNAQGSLEMFMSSVDVLKTQIGDLINESLTPMIDKAKEIIDKFIGLDDETKSSIIQLAAMAASIGPLMIGIGLLTKLLPSLASAFSFLTSPLGIVTALLAAVAISALDTEGKLGDAFSGIGEVMGIDLSEFSLDDLDISGMLDGLLGSVTDLASNPAVTGFIERLGEGLIGALGSLGDICGQIIAYIFSDEGLNSIWEAGKSIGELLLSAISNALAGILNFFDHLVDRILVSWGVISEEDLDTKRKYEQERDLSQNYKEELLKDFQKGFTDVDTGEINADELNESVMEAIILSLLEADYDYTAFTEMAGALKDKIVEAYGEGFKFSDNEEWANQEAALELSNWIDIMYSNLLSEAMSAKNEGAEFTGDTVKAHLGSLLDQLGIGADYLTDEIYQLIADQIMTGDLDTENSLLNVLFASIFGSDEEIEETAENAKDAAIANAKNAIDDVTKEFNEAVDTELTAGDVNTDEYEDAIASAKSETIDAMETVLVEGKDTIGDAAADVSNAAVQKFLATMSAKNGTTIAETFLNAMKSAIQETGAKLLNIVSVLAAAINSTISGILSYNAGYSIGYVYGSAIADGISMAMSSITTLSDSPSSSVGNSNTSVGTSGSATDTSSVAGAIKSALSNVSINMDGEKVGNLVTDTVSGNMAKSYNSRS